MRDFWATNAVLFIFGVSLVGLCFNYFPMKIGAENVAMFWFWRIINEILKVSEKILLWHCQLATDGKAAMLVVKKKTFPVLES